MSARGLVDQLMFQFGPVLGGILLHNANLGTAISVAVIGAIAVAVAIEFGVGSVVGQIDTSNHAVFQQRVQFWPWLDYWVPTLGA